MSDDIDFKQGGLYDFYKPRADFVDEHGRVNCVQTKFDASKTRQEFAEECDINEIMRRYETTGILPSNGAQAQYMDLTGVPGDLQTAMQYMIEAEAAFMRLPAVVRKEFDNSPQAFVGFAVDPENLDQMREWGLAPPAVVPPAPKEPAETPTAGQAGSPPGQK